ncbi:hypothetical protein ACS0TY_029734 [Phlomoides rotata]
MAQKKGHQQFMVTGGNGNAVAQPRTSPPRPRRPALTPSLTEQRRRALARPFSEFSGDGDGGSQTQCCRALDAAPFPLAASAQPNALTGIVGINYQALLRFQIYAKDFRFMRRDRRIYQALLRFLPFYA